MLVPVATINSDGQSWVMSERERERETKPKKKILLIFYFCFGVFRAQINISPRKISPIDQSSREKQRQTVLHELVHVLGFEPDLFTTFRKRESGEPYAASELYVSEQLWSNVTALAKSVRKVRLPRVLAAAREQYACATLTGLELEEFGGPGTAGSHWEKRVVLDELMAPTITQSSVLSSLTLALLDDSGWYTVDYRMAQLLTWGRKKGCEFVNNRCDTVSVCVCYVFYCFYKKKKQKTKNKKQKKQKNK
jgi:hypothetical protein